MCGMVPPYSQGAEASVLGSILLNNQCIESVRGAISAKEFYVESHRRIFAAMVSLSDKGIPIDHVTIGESLAQNGVLEKIGGAIALDGLTETATSTNVMHYVNIVRTKAAVRDVIYAAQTVVAKGFSDSGDTDSIEDDIAKVMSASENLARTHMPDSVGLYAPSVLETYEKVANGYRGVQLPWPTLDAMTAGMWPKTITIFVARPGVGKTFVAIICARHAWMQGKRVLIVSPEMSKEEIAERFFVIHAGVSYRDIVAGKLSEMAMPRLKKVIEAAKMMDNLWIMDSEDDISPRGIEASIRACQPELVAVDSIYDLKIKGDRKERAVAALDWMKSSAKRFNFACCGFAQQNRTAELSEKKGGGARLGTIALADEIGQDAHAVFALEQTKDDKDDKILKFKPLKLRRGQMLKSMVKSRWNFDDMNFTEIEEKEEEETFKDDHIDF